MKDNLSGQSSLDGVHHGIAVLTAHHDHFAGGDSGHLGGGGDLILILEVVLHRLLLVLDIGIHCVHDLLRLALSRLDDGNAVALHHHGREGGGKIGVAALGQVQQGEQHVLDLIVQVIRRIDGAVAVLGGARENRGVYRSIGINRNDFVALIQLRPDLPADLQAVEWVAYASNALNAMVPFYANVETTPAYLAGTTGEVSTDSFYWVSRMIAAMADASYGKSVFHVERYELGVLSACRALLNQYDAKQLAETDPARRAALRQEANEALAAEVKARAADTLDKVLFELSSNMKNAYSRSDM